MTLKELTKRLTTLALMLRADVDDPTFRAYHKALADVPDSLLDAALDRAAKGKWFPKPGDLRDYAEDARTALLQAHRFVSCGACSSDGWTERTFDGVARMVRCRCWQVHQAKLQALGVGHDSLALPAAETVE